MRPTCGHVETPGPGPGGYKGVGEGGAIGAPRGRECARPVRVTITRLPVAPDAIVKMLDEQRAGVGDKGGS